MQVEGPPTRSRLNEHSPAPLIRVQASLCYCNECDGTYFPDHATTIPRKTRTLFVLRVLASHHNLSLLSQLTPLFFSIQLAWLQYHSKGVCLLLFLLYYSCIGNLGILIDPPTNEVNGYRSYCVCWSEKCVVQVTVERPDLSLLMQRGRTGRVRRTRWPRSPSVQNKEHSS